MNLLLAGRVRLRFGFVLATLWLAVILAGCGQDSSSPVNLPTVAPNKDFPVPINQHLATLPPFTLTVWFADDYYNEAPIVDLIKEFKSAYPNISVTVQHYEWGKMRNKLKDAVANGHSPDVAHQHAFVFGAQDYAEPVDDLWQQWGTEASARFMPGALEDVTWSNKRYGVPLDINTVFLFYNKEMFKEAGLNPPGEDYNYTQLLADAHKLTKADGSRYGLAIKPGGWDTYGLVRSNGGELFQQQSDGSTATLNNPANVEILQYLSDLINKDHVTPLPNFSNGPDPVELFKQRKIAMFFSGPWDLKEIEKNGPAGLYEAVGTAPLPKGLEGKTTGSVQGGGSLFVPKGAKNREAGFEFMKWASSNKYQMRLAREMGRYPVISALYNDPYFTEQPLLKPYLEQLKTARPYKLEAYFQADIAWEQSIAAILSGSDTKTILDDANRAAQVAMGSRKSK